VAAVEILATPADPSRRGRRTGFLITMLSRASLLSRADRTKPFDGLRANGGERW